MTDHPPARPASYDKRIGLVLQGGGALGSYQAGVYEALASSEYLQSFTFRLRGREKTFLQKIDHALEKIEEGTFGLCEQCGELISLKRLEARLETTLCIRCKEDQERIEKAYG